MQQPANSAVRHNLGPLLIVLAVANCGASMAHGQRRVPRGLLEAKIYTDHVNRQNEERKQAAISQLQAMIARAQATIDECKPRLEQLESSVKWAAGRLDDAEESLKKAELELRSAKEQQAKEEKAFLEKLDQKSPYKSSLRVAEDCERRCAQETSRILGRSIENGAPDVLRQLLKKEEMARVTADAQWNVAVAELKTAQKQLVDESQAALASDPAMVALKDSVGRLTDQRKRAADEVAKARVNVNRLRAEHRSVSLRIRSAFTIQQESRMQIAAANGN